MAKEYMQSACEKDFQITDNILMVPFMALEMRFPGGGACYMEKYRASIIPALEACAILGRHKRRIARASQALAKLGFKYRVDMFEVPAQAIPRNKSTEQYREIGMEFQLSRSWFRIHPLHWASLMLEATIRESWAGYYFFGDHTTDPGTRE